MSEKLCDNLSKFNKGETFEDPAQNLKISLFTIVRNRFSFLLPTKDFLVAKEVQNNVGRSLPHAISTCVS